MPDPIEILQKVARALGPLLGEVVFVGGTTPALLIDDPAAPGLRPTKDVDVIVDSHGLRTHAEFEARLRERGFQLQPPPACRYAIDDVLVDVMTTTTQAMGFSERWYAEAFAAAKTVELPNGTTIRAITSPLFLATKLSAWHDRGNGDYYAEDLEDVLAVIDGRQNLLAEIRQSSIDVRHFLSEHFAQLLEAPGFIDAVPGHLGGDDIARQRAQMALKTIRGIIEIGDD